MSSFVLYREVSFIQSVLYQRFHCIMYVYELGISFCPTFILLANQWVLDIDSRV